MHRRTAALTLSALLACAGLAACSSSSDSGSADKTTTTKASSSVEETTTTEAAGEKLQVLVSNDDGYAAPGIDALVTGLESMGNIEVTVVAPLANQSGTGGKTTEGELKVTDVELASGHEAKAVDGFPADAIRVAMDEEGVKPDLVITGINIGQNLGPLVDASGTVGAARAGVARGVPALATSQGLGTDVDYTEAVTIIEDWVRDHQDALLAGEEPVAVTSLNVPTCGTGTMKGLFETKPDLGGDTGLALKADIDCSVAEAVTPTTLDVAAFNLGYATISPVPSKAG